MFDNEAPNIEQITQDLIAQDMPEQPEVHEQEEQPVQQEQVSKNELNIRELRLAKQRAEQERDEMARQIASYRNQQQTPQQEELDVELQPDQLVEGQHLSKMARKMKNLEQQLKNYEKKAAENSSEANLNTLYPDWRKVVTEENCMKLRDKAPQMARTLSLNPDQYSQAASVYEAIINMGIVQPDHAAPDRARVQANAAKPRPLTSLSPQQGNSPLARANEFANGLTPELSKKLWKETQMAARAS